MPIQCNVDVKRLSRDEFIERDEVVMRSAYATQNRLGRLCDERVYENHLATSLRAEGMRSVLTQVPIHLTHGASGLLRHRFHYLIESASVASRAATRMLTAQRISMDQPQSF